MPPTTSYSRGDILLVPFPFSDQTSVKQRPALVISADNFQQDGPDLLIMAITSQIGGALRLGEFLIRDWQAAGLLKPSAIKAAITTIETKLCPPPFRPPFRSRPPGAKHFVTKTFVSLMLVSRGQNYSNDFR